MDIDFDKPAFLMKRKKVSEPDSPSKQASKRQKAKYEDLPMTEKLDKIFDAFKKVGWTLGDFLHHVFAHRDVHRSKRHAAIVQRYLSGKGSRHVGNILESWLSSPDDAGYDQGDFMYTTATPYSDIPHVRAALTSFAAQIVKEKLLRDVKAGVKVTGGLHVPSEKKLSPEDGTGRFADLATGLMDNMKAVIMSHQGLLYDYVLALATPDPISRKGLVTERRNRPPELTAISTISMISFCRNHFARLYPLVRGIVYMASHVPVDVIALNSHLGTMPSINTIKSALKGFSKLKAIRIQSMGRDTGIVYVNGVPMVKVVIITFDNSQHFRRQRERRIGKENTMVIGISATYMQKLVAAAALDPLDKRFRISLNLHLTITVEDITTRIDFPHL
ncbi:hypothetical protein MVEN_02307900 [Mycena venus]|uniref:Uncharacterized protein n=1 Tax=Mycena venus TaxID=2733690 RepID=A0A8H6X4I8_9AGAR|nr:hypothetical protein MVEN_02307900 [Mycena venus]